MDKYSVRFLSVVFSAMRTPILLLQSNGCMSNFDKNLEDVCKNRSPTTEIKSGNFLFFCKEIPTSE